MNHWNPALILFFLSVIFSCVLRKEQPLQKTIVFNQCAVDPTERNIYVTDNQIKKWLATNNIDGVPNRRDFFEENIYTLGDSTFLNLHYAQRITIDSTHKGEIVLCEIGGVISNVVPVSPRNTDVWMLVVNEKNEVVDYLYLYSSKSPNRSYEFYPMITSTGILIRTREFSTFQIGGPLELEYLKLNSFDSNPYPMDINHREYNSYYSSTLDWPCVETQYSFDLLNFEMKKCIEVNNYKNIKSGCNSSYSPKDSVKCKSLLIGGLNHPDGHGLDLYLNEYIFRNLSSLYEISFSMEDSSNKNIEWEPLLMNLTEEDVKELSLQVNILANGFKITVRDLTGVTRRIEILRF